MAKTMSSGGSKDSTKPLVLVVDDHASQRRLFQILADRLKITAHVVESGEEALEAVESYQFDAILMDVVMPQMNGFECTKKIREMEQITDRHIPIIAVTACVMKGDREKCLDAGMDDYLPKPFTLKQFGEKLNQWLSRD
jgi:CheY-like chemotaxis protein